MSVSPPEVENPEDSTLWTFSSSFPRAVPRFAGQTGPRIESGVTLGFQQIGQKFWPYYKVLVRFAEGKYE